MARAVEPAQSELKKLEDLYLNPATGLVGLAVLKKKAKARKIKLTDKQIADFYRAYATNQIFRPFAPPESKVNLASRVPSPGYLQIDLMDVSRYAGNNKNVKYLLNVIDIFSRYVWSVPLKDKKPPAIAEAMKRIFELLKRHNIGVWKVKSDRGNEFQGEVRRFFLEKEILIEYSDPTQRSAHTQLAFIDSFTRTLWNRIRKYMALRGTTRYIDDLKNIIAGYNTTVHSSIKTKPITALTKGTVWITEDELRERAEQRRKTQGLKVGDKVRIWLKPITFEKKSITPQYSTTVYEIIDIKGGAHTLRAVATGEVLDVKYPAGELLKVQATKGQAEIEKLAIKRGEIKKITRSNTRNIRSGLDLEQIPSEKGPTRQIPRAPARTIPDRPVRTRTPSLRVIDNALQ